ncbi:MAG: hypothetical protein E7320_08860 [Clostridiales bacterium]|nr:hypothetical protein [Clostridiales bacterium]
MNNALAIIFLVVIAYAIYALRVIFYEGILWGWLAPVLIVAGFVVDATFSSVLGIFLCLVGFVILVSAHIYSYQKNEDRRTYTHTSSPSTRSNRYSSMPGDAHDQVEALARLIYVVYKNDPYAKNDFAKGHLFLYRDNNNNCVLDFWYDWDYGPAESIVRENYVLDSRITFDDGETIRYRTNNVEHFDWIIHPMTNSYYFDPVVATLQNECPGLQITQREVTQSGIRLSFKYR